MKELTAADLESCRSEGGVLILDAYTEWCHPCKLLAPVLEKISQGMPNVKFAKMNVENEKDVAIALGISSVPCVFVFKAGQLVDKIVGLLPEKSMRERLNEAITNGKASEL